MIPRIATPLLLALLTAPPTSAQLKQEGCRAMGRLIHEIAALRDDGVEENEVTARLIKLTAEWHADDLKKVVASVYTSDLRPVQFAAGFVQTCDKQ